MRTFLIYVDAENISFSDLKDYLDVNAISGNIIGKAYGSSTVLGEAAMDFLRIGFQFVETSHLSESSKNVADMKILTDCAFDVLRTFAGVQVQVVLLTKDCDFMPLVYQLLSIGVPTEVPMLGKDKTIAVPVSTVSELLSKCNYDPMNSDAWLLPQIGYIDSLIGNEIDISFIDRYCSRKRNRFIRSIAVINPYFATKLEDIAKDDFSAEAVYCAAKDIGLQTDTVMRYLNMYANKYFGKAFKSDDLRNVLERLDRG